MARKLHSLFALLCISALDPNLTHIIFAESVFEDVTSADSHIFQCIFIRHVFFVAHFFCQMCFISSENHTTGNSSMLLFSAGKGKDHIRIGHEDPEEV